MSVLFDTPSIFSGPPAIPKEITGIVKYELQANAYYKKLKNVTAIFLELLAALLVLGIIWINVDWVKAVVTGIAIGIALVLIYLLRYIFS